MKRKNVVGLVAIIAIAVMALFTGCIDEKAPTPTPSSTTPTTVVTPSPNPSPIARPSPAVTPRGPGWGVGGECICPNCGYTMTHKRDVACYDLTCPKCGAQMIRKGP